MKRTPALGTYRNPRLIPDDRLAVATPQQIIEAWSYGVMHGEWAGQDEDTRKHPPTIDDPTFRRDEYEGPGGWHSAADIQSTSAQRGLAGYLRARGLRVPDHTQKSWDELNRRSEIREDLLREVRAEMVRTEENAYEPGHPTLEDYASDIQRRLGTLLGASA